MASEQREATRLPLGTPVQVRDRFEFVFRRGFEVSGATTTGYRLRRRSDGTELPATFSADDVRPETAGTWR